MSSLTRTAPRLPRGAVLRDLATGIAAGTAVGVPVAVLFGALGFPYWAETVAGFCLVLGCLLPVAVLFRLTLHAVNRWIDAGMRDLDPDRRPLDVGLTRWPVVVSTAFLVAWLWSVLASGLLSGDWSP